MARSTYQDGSVDLIAQFTDGNGTLIDPDTTPVIDIFPPNYDPDLSSTTDSDALLLGQTTTKVSTGVYLYTYTTAPDAETGTYYDRWRWTEDSISLDYRFEFTVIERVNVASFEPVYNQFIIVYLYNRFYWYRFFQNY